MSVLGTLWETAKALLALAFIAAVVIAAIPFGMAVIQGVQQGLNAEPATEAGVKKALVERVNNVRERRGLEPLASSSDLAIVADEHSRDMAVKNYFDHTQPDGDTRENRYRSDGVVCQTAGENLFHMMWDGTIYTSQEVANKTVQSWLNSPTHRANLLSPKFREQGIGVEIVKRGEETHVYVTQDFCG